MTEFTNTWTNGRGWFRGEDTGTFLVGKKVEDYVYEAIGRFLESPEKYDSNKGELLEYLKYQLVRTLVGNDLRKLENTTSADIFAYDELSEEDEDISPYSERVMPYTAALFPDAGAEQPGADRRLVGGGAGGTRAFGRGAAYRYRDEPAGAYG